MESNIDISQTISYAQKPEKITLAKTLKRIQMTKFLLIFIL
jgi:hypothetical protein